MAKPEPVGFDPPPERLQVLGGGKFAGQAPPVTGVAPLGGRADYVGQWHEPT